MSAAQSNPSTPLRRPLTKGRRILFISIYLLFFVGLVWVGYRLLNTIRYGAPLAGRDDAAAVWDHFYPELKNSGIAGASLTKDDDYFDVLLLGASVLDQVSALVEQELIDRMGGNLRVFNVSRKAHTSCDSYLKIKNLEDKYFDLIIVYHGINDVRMNCCSETRFKDDYTHCFWYKSIECRLTGKLIPPQDLVADLIPLEAPSPKMRAYGNKIKTVETFHRNLDAIVSHAQSKQQLVVLMTFAYYIPPDYSFDRFRHRRLGYGPTEMPWFCPLEIWGEPINVARTIDAHNQSIRAIAERYDNVVFVDQIQQIPKDGKHFSDPCHLTAAGCRLFVDNVASKILGQRDRHSGKGDQN